MLLLSSFIHSSAFPYKMKLLSMAGLQQQAVPGALLAWW
jgi:hypothetical protein